MPEHRRRNRTAFGQEAIQQAPRCLEMSGQLLGHDLSHLGIGIVQQALDHVFELHEIVRRVVGLADEHIDEHTQQHRAHVETRPPAQPDQPLQRIPKAVPLVHAETSRRR